MLRPTSSSSSTTVVCEKTCHRSKRKPGHNKGTAARGSGTVRARSDGVDLAHGATLEEESTQDPAEPQTNSPSICSEHDWNGEPSQVQEWFRGAGEERIPRDALGGSHRHDPSADFDIFWPTPDVRPVGWDPPELCPPPPNGPQAIAALLHGDNLEFFVYALVLGRELRDQSPRTQEVASSSSSSRGEGLREQPPDRVLICGPGDITASPEHRRALREAGWTHLLPVCAIEASHLDKTSRKRHAMVFTKLKVLELPYRQILMVDIDLIPRGGCNLSELLKIQAPAAKYHCSSFEGEHPTHGQLIPNHLVTGQYWCPNCGVLRVDPLPTLHDRRQLVQEMVQEVMAISEEEASYLPEQYYLSRFTGWRQISHLYNWEIWPQYDDPDMTHPTHEAKQEMERLGWGNTKRGSWDSEWRNAKVWHFSGTGETSPFNFAHLPAGKARDESASCFRARDQSGCIATAHFEWISALDRLETTGSFRTPSSCLRRWRSSLKQNATFYRGVPSSMKFCVKCGKQTFRARRLTDLPYDGKWCDMWQPNSWVRPDEGYWCRDCVVAILKGQQECSCEAWSHRSWYSSWSWWG